MKNAKYTKLLREYMSRFGWSIDTKTFNIITVKDKCVTKVIRYDSMKESILEVDPGTPKSFFDFIIAIMFDDCCEDPAYPHIDVLIRYIMLDDGYFDLYSGKLIDAFEVPEGKALLTRGWVQYPLPEQDLKKAQDELIPCEPGVSLENIYYYIYLAIASRNEAINPSVDSLDPDRKFIVFGDHMKLFRHLLDFGFDPTSGGAGWNLKRIIPQDLFTVDDIYRWTGEGPLTHRDFYDKCKCKVRDLIREDTEGVMEISKSTRLMEFHEPTGSVSSFHILLIRAAELYAGKI